MTVRNVRKNLAGQQDLLPGVGPYQQMRRGNIVMLDGLAKSYIELWKDYCGEAYAGTFEDGFTADPGDIAVSLINGKAYKYTGATQVVIAENSLPNASWVEVKRTDIQLRDYDALRAYTGKLQSIYITGVIGTAGPEGIAGHFKLRPNDTTSIDDGGIVIVDNLGRRWFRQYDSTINVQWFGDFDSNTDHRPFIQSALDAVTARGGKLDFPPRTDGYTVKSEHPLVPGHALVLDITAKPDQYTRGGVSLTGYDFDSRIKLDTGSDITSLLYVPGRINYLRMSGMWLDANNKADYGFLASDDYNPFMGLEHSKFYRAKLACARISTFLSDFTGCFFGESGQDGLRLVGIGSGPVTSVTMNNCYAVRNARRGYDFGYLTYCSLNSCAADRNPLAYYFNIASGVAMNGCGAETCEKALQVTAYRGFALNGMYMLSVGSEDPQAPQPYLVEFGSGYGATVQGIRKESSRYYTYLLGSTAASTGNDNITVLDGSVNRDTAYWVPSANFARPIKFLRDDGTEKNITIAVTSAQQLFDIATKYESYSVNHDFVLDLADGVYDLTNLLTIFSKLKGNGSLYIRGNSSTPTSVQLNTAANKLRFADCSCRIYLKDLVIIGTVASNSYKRVTFTNCYNVILDRVGVLRNGVNVGVGIENINSNIYMIRGSGVDTTSFGTAPITITSGGRIELEDQDSDPLYPGWFPGAKYYFKTLAVGGYVGKVWISAAVGWRSFGAIV